MNTANLNNIQRTVEGLNLSRKNGCKLVASEQAIYIKAKDKDKVSVIVCGRNGFETMMGYLLGENLADAIITDPNLNPYAIMRTAIAVARGKGVLFLCGYEEQERSAVLSAGGLLEEAGFSSEVVYLWDNIDPDATGDESEKRASAGIYFCTKIAGAAAAQGLSLKETYYIAREARALTKSISIGVRRGEKQQESNSILEMPAELELGLGSPREKECRKTSFRTAKDLVERMAFHLLCESRIRPGDTICAYISGIGGTCFSDLCRVSFLLHQILEEKKMYIYDTVINPIPFKANTLGVTVSLMRLPDEMKPFYDAPCRAFYYEKG